MCRAIMRQAGLGHLISIGGARALGFARDDFAGRPIPGARLGPAGSSIV